MHHDLKNNLTIKEFEKYYKNHLDMDYKLNNLLFFMIDLYNDYSLENTNTQKKDSVAENRLNNLHKDIKDIQEDIYVNRLKMSEILNTNNSINSNNRCFSKVAL